MGNFGQLTSANTAGIQYVWTVAAAYRRFAWLIDPDFATQNEPEAWNKIRRDADIAHAIMKRRQAVAGLHWNHEPVEDNDEDKIAAQLMDFLVGRIRRFHFSRYNLAEAIFRGSSWAFIDGDRQPLVYPGDRVRTWWAPNKLRHVDRFRFRLVREDTYEENEIETRWEFFSIKRQEWIPLERPDLFVRHDFEQTEDTLGYGHGLLQSIYYFWRAKEIVLSQALNGIERFANGTATVAVDGLRAGSTDRNNDEIVDEWIDEYTKQRTQHILVHDKRDEVRMLDWPATGAQMIWETYDRLQQGLDRLILTSTLPTGGGTEKGSLARSSTEEEQMEATFQADRQGMSETIDGSVSSLVWMRNLGIIRAFFAERGMRMPNRPHFKISQQKINDPKTNVDVLERASRIGLPMLLKQIYTKLDLTQPAPDDEVLEPATPATPGLSPGFGDLFRGRRVVRFRDIGRTPERMIDTSPIPVYLEATVRGKAEYYRLQGLATAEAVALAMREAHDAQKPPPAGDTNVKVLMPDQRFDIRLPDEIKMPQPIFQVPVPYVNVEAAIMRLPNIDLQPIFQVPQAPPAAPAVPAAIEFKPMIVMPEPKIEKVDVTANVVAKVEMPKAEAKKLVVTRDEHGNLESATIKPVSE